MDIPPYQPQNMISEPNTSRPRKLLLNKKEISEIEKSISSERTSIIPLELHNKGNKIKVKIGLGRSRRKADKREVIKKRDISKEVGKRIK